MILFDHCLNIQFYSHVSLYSVQSWVWDVFIIVQHRREDDFAIDENKIIFIKSRQNFYQSFDLKSIMKKSWSSDFLSIKTLWEFWMFATDETSSISMKTIFAQNVWKSKKSSFLSKLKSIIKSALKIANHWSSLKWSTQSKNFFSHSWSSFRNKI